jgi:hypothetical protein
MHTNLCFTDSFIQKEEAESMLEYYLDQIDTNEWEVTEASVSDFNGKSVVRIMAKPRQMEFEFGNNP